MTKEKVPNSRADYVTSAIKYTLLGLLMFYIIFKMTQLTNWYKVNVEGWKSVPASVTSFTTSGKQGFYPTYVPSYQYEIDGRTYQGVSVDDSRSKPQIGQTITILYHPKSPELSRHASDTSPLVWAVSVILFGSIGLAFLRLGILAIILAKQDPTETELVIPDGPVRKHRDFRTLLVGAAIFIPGSLILLLSTGQIRTMFYGWNITAAQVVDYEVNRGGRTGRSYDTIYQYQVNGEQYKGKAVVSRKTRPTIGSTISIAYNSKHPWSSYPSEGHNILMIIIAPIISLLYLGFSTYFIIIRWRKRRKIAQAKAIGDFYEGFIIELTPAKNHTSIIPIHDILIEFAIEEDYYQTSISLPLTEDNFILYGQDPTPIPVYPNPDDFYEFLVDDNDIYAVANKPPVEAIGGTVFSNIDILKWPIFK